MAEKITIDTPGLQFYEKEEAPFAFDPNSWNLFRVEEDNQLVSVSSSILAALRHWGSAISKSEAVKLADDRARARAMASRADE